MYLTNTVSLHNELKISADLFDKKIEGLSQGGIVEDYLEKLESAFIPIGALDLKLNQFSKASVAEKAAHDAALMKIEHNRNLYNDHLNSQYRLQTSVAKQRSSVQIYDIKRIVEKSYGQFIGLNPELLICVPSNVESFLEQESSQSIQGPNDFNEAVNAVNAAVKNVGPAAMVAYGAIAICAGSLVLFVFHLPLFIALTAAFASFGFFLSRILRAKEVTRHLAKVSRISCEFSRSQFIAAAAEINNARRAALAQAEIESNTEAANEVERFRNLKLSFINDVNRFDEQLAKAAVRLGDLVRAWIKAHERQFSPLGSYSAKQTHSAPQILLRIGECLTKIADTGETVGVV